MPSIEKRGDRSWRLIVEAGLTADGTRDKKRKTIKVEDPALLKTKKKLREYLESEWWKFKDEVETGTYIKSENMTLKEFATSHFIPKYVEKELSETTLETYRQNFKVHIYPFFGHKKMDEIKTMHIVDFVTYLGTPEARKDGKMGDDRQPLCLRTGTQRHIYVLLHRLFTRAVEWKVLKSNPCEGVTWPDQSEPNVVVYENDELDTILDALTSLSDTWRLLILGTYLSGFRRGEMVATELTDLNFNNNTIMIDENIPMKIKGEAIIKTPKTKSSIRAVSMPDWYMEELALYVQEWENNKLAMGDKWKGGDRQFLFHAGYGRPFHPGSVTNRWNKFLKDNEIRHVKLHGLRHTSATYLLENGATIEAVKKRLGHASQRSTEIYLHTTKAVEKSMAQKFDRFNPNSKSVPNSSPNEISEK
ncbi:site-specific integrase [Anaerospora hongkongensis]|uniref:site-specific integrase n=1 Tax=Anaerospora hongkongensis TaxID=244830 RepID=UPI00289D60D7|nr:site-specific integrase [Anaerospora hongkongensis]